MARVKAYLRIARHPGGRKPFKVWAGVSPNPEPIRVGTNNDVMLPTAHFAVVLDIPDEMFRRAEQVLAVVDVPEDVLAVAVRPEPTEE